MIDLDDADRELLDALLREGRRSYASLARDLNIAEPSVRRRVRRLEEAGIITGYGARIDYTAIGLPVRALIRVRVAPNDGAGLVRAMAERVPEIIAATVDRTFLLLVVCVESVPHLVDVLGRLTPDSPSKLKPLIVQTDPSDFAAPWQRNRIGRL